MNEDWFFYSLTFSTFVVIFLFCYIRHVFTFFERNRIERASYPTFPFGNVYDVLFEKIPMFMQLWKFYNRFKKKKCKYGGFYLFLKPAVVVTDSQLIRAVLTKTEYFGDLSVDSNVFGEELNKKLLEKIPKIVRNVWSKILTPIEDEEVNCSQIICQDFQERSIRELFDLNENFQYQENRSILYMFRKILSISYPGLTLTEKSDQKKTFYVDLLKNVVETRAQSKIKKDDLLAELIENGVPTTNFVEIISLIVYNLNMCNNLVLFTLYELTINNEIQEDLRGEITRFRKSHETVDYSDLNNLSYLETVVCETLRKYPLKLFLYKICKTKFSEGGVNWPKDLLLFISTFGIHHDAQNYINPELFDPDRFSQENEKFIEEIKYLPFGAASNNDFGTLCVKLMMKLTLVELLGRFRFSLGEKSPRSVQFDERYFDFLKTKEDMWLKVSKKLS